VDRNAPPCGSQTHSATQLLPTRNGQPKLTCPSASTPPQKRRSQNSGSAPAADDAAGASGARGVGDRGPDKEKRLRRRTNEGAIAFGNRKTAALARQQRNKTRQANAAKSKMLDALARGASRIISPRGPAPAPHAPCR